MTGGSGLGKTALLANWVRSLEREDSAICYQFVSRRDRTAGDEFFFLNLCQQLAAFHRLGGSPPANVSEMKALFSHLIQLPPEANERLIIVVDGLDEAQGWSAGLGLFPAELPDGVLVVFSARRISGVNWLQKLDLAAANVVTLELDRLRPAAIAALLRAAGDAPARIAKDRKLLKLVVEKSEGDPFFLRFLLDDLRKPEDAIERLRKNPPGLDAYLADWWNEVSAAAQEDSVSDFLGYVLVAKGPLTRDELIEISDTDALRGATFERVIGLVGRYLVQDDDGGFEFCHPRFREYISENRIKDREQRTYRARLLEYCGRWKEQPSDYTFAHYAEHLRDAGRLADLYGLVSKPWMEEKCEKYHTHQSFSADVRLAIETAAAESPPNVYEMARTSVIGASLASLATAVPLDLIRVLALNGEFGRALGHLSLHPEPEKRIQGFLWVAEAEWKRRDRKTAHRDCVRAARELFRSEEFEGRGALREQSLALLYQVAGSEGLLELAESEGWRDTIVSSLVGILQERSELEEAFTLAESLEDEWPKKNCITDLARAWLDRREVERAMDLVDAAPTIWGTRSSDYNFIDHLTQTLVDLADWRLFQKVAARLSRVDRDISLLTGVIKGAVKAGKLDFARQISCLPGSDEWRGGAILALAYYLAGDGRCDEALEVARSGEGPWRVRAVAMIAAAMEGRTVPPALEAEARAAAEHLDSIADDHHETDAARYLSCALAPDDPLAVNLARSALHSAVRVDKAARGYALESAGKALARVGLWDLVRESLAAIPEPWQRDQDVRSQALAMVQAGEYERAAELSTLSGSAHSGLEFAQTVGPPLVEAGQLPAAIALATGLEGDYYREEALKPIVDALMSKKEYRLAVESLQSVKPYYRRKILEKILPALVEAQEYELASDAVYAEGVELVDELLKHLTWVAVRSGREDDILKTPGIPEYSRAQIELELCRALLAQGDLDRASARARANHGEHRGQALSEVAVAFGRKGRLAEAREISGLMKPYERNQALREIIEVLIERQQRDEASDLAGLLSDEDSSDTLHALFEAYLEAGDYAAAEEMAAERSAFRAELARALAENGQLPRAVELANELLSSSGLEQTTRTDGEWLGSVAHALIAVGELDAASLLIESAPAREQGRLLGDMSVAQAEAGDLERALKTLDGLDRDLFANHVYSADALLGIAQMFMRRKQPEVAAGYARRSLEERFWVAAKQDTFLRLLNTGLHEEVGQCYGILHSAGLLSTPSQIVDEIRASGRGIDDYLLSAVAVKLAQDKAAGWALAIIEEIQDHRHIRRALGSVAEALATAGLATDAVAVSKRVLAFAEDHPDQRVLIDFGQVAKAIALAGNKADSEACLSAIASFEKDRDTSYAAVEVAFALVARGELAEAERLARAIGREANAAVRARAALVLVRCGHPEEAKSRGELSLHPWAADYLNIPDELIQASAEAGDARLAIRLWVKANSRESALPPMVVSLLQKRAPMSAADGTAWWLQEASGVLPLELPAALSLIAAELERQGRHDEALLLELQAIQAARFEGRSTAFAVLRNGAKVLALIDKGRTLLRIHEALLSLDDWWTAKA